MKIKFPKEIIRKTKTGICRQYELYEYCGFYKTEYKHLHIVSTDNTYQIIATDYSNLPWVLLSEIPNLKTARKEVKIYMEEHKRNNC